MERAKASRGSVKRKPTTRREDEEDELGDILKELESEKDEDETLTVTYVTVDGTRIPDKVPLHNHR